MVQRVLAARKAVGQAWDVIGLERSLEVGGSIFAVPARTACYFYSVFSRSGPRFPLP